MIIIRTSHVILLNGLKSPYNIEPGNYTLEKIERDGETWLVLSDRRHIGLPIDKWLRVSNRFKPLTPDASEIFAPAT